MATQFNTSQREIKEPSPLRLSDAALSVSLASLPVADDENKESCCVIVPHECVIKSNNLTKIILLLFPLLLTLTPYTVPHLLISELSDRATLKPLEQFTEVWRAPPGKSRWVLNMIISGYILQVAHRQTHFPEVALQVQAQNALVLRAEIHNLFGFLRFASEGMVYQFTVLLFSRCLAPRTFTKCMNAVLSPLHLNRVRAMNYLDDWLLMGSFNERAVQPPRLAYQPL